VPPVAVNARKYVTRREIKNTGREPCLRSNIAHQKHSVLQQERCRYQTDQRGSAALPGLRYRNLGSPTVGSRATTSGAVGLETKSPEARDDSRKLDRTSLRSTSLRTLKTGHCPHSPDARRAAACCAAIDRYLLSAGPTAGLLLWAGPKITPKGYWQSAV